MDQPRCTQPNQVAFHNATPSALFQISLESGQLRAQFVRGVPYDQLSMDASAQEFRALSVWVDPRCQFERKTQLTLTYLHTPLSAFSTRPRAIPESSYTRLPSVGASIENRFTDDYLVYGGRPTWRSNPPDAESRIPLESSIVAVPVTAPDAPTILRAPHNVLRIERVGDNAVVTGYRDQSGVNVSMIDLRAAPRIAATTLLQNRFETEGRSHAFNSVTYADGAGLMGLPTAMRADESDRYPWRSDSSDVSFLAFDASGTLSSIGPLRSRAEEDATYECEVSCIDWYGNSRALFIGDRVFALSGTELIEGAVAGAAIQERARVNLTAPVPRPTLTPPRK
jgi:hypothetical protein